MKQKTKQIQQNAQTGVTPFSIESNEEIVLSGDPALVARLKALNKKESAKAATILVAGKEVIEATGTLTDKYRSLVKAVRDAGLGPRTNTDLLLGLGFAKTRASEINKLAMDKSTFVTDYLSGTLGFKGALEMVRAGITTAAAPLLMQECEGVTPGSPIDVAMGNHPGSAAALQAATDDETGGSASKGKKNLTATKRAARLAAQILTLAAKGKLRLHHEGNNGLPKSIEWEAPGLILELRALPPQPKPVK